MSDVDRSVDHEQGVTARAGRLCSIDPERLQCLAEQRAPAAPLRDFWNRPWLIEVLEELADARNYICWAVYVLYLTDDPDYQPAITSLIYALSSVITAADHIYIVKDAWESFADAA